MIKALYSYNQHTVLSTHRPGRLCGVTSLGCLLICWCGSVARPKLQPAAQVCAPAAVQEPPVGTAGGAATVAPAIPGEGSFTGKVIGLGVKDIILDLNNGTLFSDFGAQQWTQSPTWRHNRYVLPYHRCNEAPQITKIYLLKPAP